MTMSSLANFALVIAMFTIIERVRISSAVRLSGTEETSEGSSRKESSGLEGRKTASICSSLH